MAKALNLAAKSTQPWLSIAQLLAGGRLFSLFLFFLKSVCLSEHFYKGWEKSIWYFYHPRAT